MSWFSIIGVLFVIFIFWRFLKEIGNGLPILELLVLLAGLQWIIGPIISYKLDFQHYKYYMYVDELTYMSYVVPGYILFSIILLFKKIKFTISENINFAVRYGKTILAFGIIADVLSLFAPPSLAFFVFLVAQFKYVGAGLLIFSSSKREKIYFYIAIFYLFIISLASAMFHDFLLWGSFLFMLWAIKEKPSMKMKSVIIFSGLFLAIGIQAIKEDFRGFIWSGYSGNKLSLFVNILSEKIFNSELNENLDTGELNVRLNQGWIISATMLETPSHQPFANGSTILDATFASILPRFLNPYKKQAGGRENFILYTGLELGSTTSMGLSIIGESYANFGVFGGILFMAIWGWILIFYWNKLILISINHPLLFFFIPLIFLQVVKSETELVVVLNHLVKSSIVVFMFFWFSRKYLNWKI